MNTTQLIPVVTDEVDFFQKQIPTRAARVLELGCGKAAFARELLRRGLAVSVKALEVDRLQHQANLGAPPMAGLSFECAGAETIPLPDQSCDVVVMLKSLHHVPIAELDNALKEIRRVLVSGGWLYVSEPVYAGDFNDIIKLFHDEGEVRAAAYAALQRAAKTGELRWEREVLFDTPLDFSDFDDFVNRIVRVTHSNLALPSEVEGEVRRRFASFQTHDGAHFMRPMRVNILRRG